LQFDVPDVSGSIDDGIKYDFIIGISRLLIIDEQNNFLRVFGKKGEVISLFLSGNSKGIRESRK